MILKDSAFIFQRLPWDCEPTILGDLMGANQQYRGPKGLQVRQYGNLLIGHFDKIDPREDSVGHLLADAPVKAEFALGGCAAAAAAKWGSPTGLS